MKYSNLFTAFEYLGLDPPKEEVDELVSTYATQVKINNTLWHTTNANYWFSVGDIGTFVYKIKLFVAIWIALANDEQDVASWCQFHQHIYAQLLRS